MHRRCCARRPPERRRCVRRPCSGTARCSIISVTCLKGSVTASRFRHDRAHAGRRLGECRGQQRKSGFQTEFQRLVVRRGDLVGSGEQRLTEPVTRTPAVDARGTIARQHLGAVVEQQPRSQADAPTLAVVFGHRAVSHLRPRVEARIEPEQRIEHQKAVIAGLIGGGPYRIEHRQVSLGHELQHLAGGAARDGRYRQRGGRAGDETASSYGTSLPGAPALHVNATGCDRSSRPAGWSIKRPRRVPQNRCPGRRRKHFGPWA